jgi:hypothetical protein
MQDLKQRCLADPGWPFDDPDGTGTGLRSREKPSQARKLGVALQQALGTGDGSHAADGSDLCSFRQRRRTMALRERVPQAGMRAAAIAGS